MGRYEVLRLNKYARDCLTARVKNGCEKAFKLVEETSKYDPIILIGHEIEQALVSLCSKGPSFVPTPTNVDWNEIQKSWLDFKRKLRWRSFFYGRETASNFGLEVEAPYKKLTKETPLSKVPAIEVFLNSVEKDLFDVKNEKKVMDNLTLSERAALKQFRTTPVPERNLIVRNQDKSNNFVFLDKDTDTCKVREQMDRGSFRILDHDISSETCSNILKWIERWGSRDLSERGIEFITEFNEPHPGVNYPLIKTHKPDNLARVIASDCGTPIENYHCFKKYCKIVVDSIPCRVRDTAHMLDISDELNTEGV